MKELKYSFTRDDLISLLMKKGMPWASPSLDAWVFLKYAGMNHGGIPKLRLLTLLDHVISSFSLDPWKLPSHQTRSNLISGLVHNQKFTCSAWTQSLPTLLDITHSYWNLMEQRNPLKHSKRGNAKIKDRICQHRTVCKDKFFRCT